MKYSKLQYFFWIISGSEITVLKECENEYNRHTNIGMMILITSIFAGFTAFIAGRTFVKDNLLGPLAFAFVWAILIFIIDRSMVNSIKKDPSLENQPFWSYFAPRLVLAFILAFFMSIPLDHIVFEEKIKRAIIDNNNADWIQRQKELNAGYNIEGTEKTISTFQATRNMLDNELKSDCPLPTYKEALKNYEDCNQGIPPLEKDYNDKKAQVSNYYNQLQAAQNTRRPALNGRYYELKRNTEAASISLTNHKKQCQEYYKTAIGIKSEWEKNLTAKIIETDNSITNNQNKLETDQTNVQLGSAEFKKTLEEMKGFDTQFTTLFLMPNWGVQVLKWAIFLALLVIEILPTYLKLKTPVGQYDRKMQEREEIMTNEIQARISSERNISQQTESYRVTEEVKLNKKIINRIATLELKLAQELLDEWEQKARAQLKRNVEEATNHNND